MLMTTIYTSGKSINDLNDKLSNEMEVIHSWCISNGMVINQGKTKSMVVCTRQRATKIGTTDLSVSYDGTIPDHIAKVLIIDRNHFSYLVN